ncbi:MAG: hypothetical protein IPL08_16605 [Saprospiraceae bacterium]|nr:hypothetical protein [Saprospiraceae bacterium]
MRLVQIIFVILFFLSCNQKNEISEEFIISNSYTFLKDCDLNCSKIEVPASIKHIKKTTGIHYLIRILKYEQFTLELVFSTNSGENELQFFFTNENIEYTIKTNFNDKIQESKGRVNDSTYVWAKTFLKGHLFFLFEFDNYIDTHLIEKTFNEFCKNVKFNDFISESYYTDLYSSKFEIIDSLNKERDDITKRVVNGVIEKSIDSKHYLYKENDLKQFNNCEELNVYYTGIAQRFYKNANDGDIFTVVKLRSNGYIKRQDVLCQFIIRKNISDEHVSIEYSGLISPVYIDKEIISKTL